MQECVQRYGSRPAGREVSGELDASLNIATIDYHSIRLRLGFTACGCSGRGERRVHSKHPQAATNCTNAPRAETVNRQFKDNLGQIFEH